MTAQSLSIRITKFEAARKQLNTAIQLWFNDDDPVSIHVLAFSAYDVIHAVSKKRNPNRPDLLFDAKDIKDELRGKWSVALKTPSGFFKHARNDPESSIDFQPQLSELLMLFTIRGIAACGLVLTTIEAAFLFWNGVHDPSFFSDEGRKQLLDPYPIEAIEDIRRLPKRMFLDEYLKANKNSPPAQP